MPLGVVLNRWEARFELWLTGQNSKRASITGKRTFFHCRLQSWAGSVII